MAKRFKTIKDQNLMDLDGLPAEGLNQVVIPEPKIGSDLLSGFPKPNSTLRSPFLN